MRAVILACVCTLPLAACNNGPDIQEENASVAEVANKVADAGGATQFVRPGRWESTVTIEEMSIPGMPAEAAAQIGGMQGQEQTSVSCLTEAEAKRPKEDFFAGNNKSCRYDRFTMADGKIDAVMQCANEGGTQTMTMRGNYSPTTYNMTMAMQGDGAAVAGMAMKMRVEARHRGQCTGDEAA